MIYRSEQIAESLEKQIRSGELSGKLPSEKEMARHFSTAVMTVARAMELLKLKGLIRQVHRRGTFVIPPETKTIRLWGKYYFAARHPELLKAGIPDVEIVPAASLEESDLAVFTTSMPMNYSSHFLPWPPQMVRELQESGDYYPQAFEFHHIGTPVYSVAYNFCPQLLFYHRKRIRELCGKTDPYGITYGDLLRMAFRYPEEFFSRVNDGTPLLFALAYSRSSLSAVLAEYQQFTGGKNNRKRSPHPLFRMLFRQSAFQEKDLEEYDVMPMPEMDGRRYCHAASEALFVPLNSRYPELALQLAVSSLSPGFQRAVAASRENIPSRKEFSAASEASFHDEIFFREIPNIHYPREIIDPVSAAVILAGLKQLASMYMTPEVFANLLTEEEEIARRRSQAMKMILNGKNDL